MTLFTSSFFCFWELVSVESRGQVSDSLRGSSSCFSGKVGEFPESEGEHSVSWPPLRWQCCPVAALSSASQIGDQGKFLQGSLSEEVCHNLYHFLLTCMLQSWDLIQNYKHVWTINTSRRSFQFHEAHVKPYSWSWCWRPCNVAHRLSPSCSYGIRIVLLSTYLIWHHLCIVFPLCQGKFPSRKLWKGGASRNKKNECSLCTRSWAWYFVPFNSAIILWSTHTALF